MVTTDFAPSSMHELLSRAQELPPLLTVPQSAELLGISRSAAYRAVDRKELPTVRLSGRIRVPLVHVLAILGLTGPLATTHEITTG